jgi:hypothetical protein
LAVNAGAVATPLPFVTPLDVDDPLNAPLAPVPGAVNVTVTPLTGLLFESFTVACSAVPKFVPTVALCGVPAVALILDATPALPPASAAPLRCTLPPLPEVITQLTVKVCPADAALYVSV